VTRVTVTTLTSGKTYFGEMFMLDAQALLDLLKAELDFLEYGGYRGNPHNAWRPNFVFEDSPTCLNYRMESQPRHCRECALLAFVPINRKETRYPCRHIPLTALGETVSSFYEYGTQEELEAALRVWLRKNIQELEEGKKSRSQVA
jgi:hypothetical protein